MSNYSTHNTYVISLMAILFVGAAFAQHQKFYAHEQFVSPTDTLNYRIMYPKKFKESNQYPLILFLHGAGERGSDNAKQLTHGSALFANRKHRRKFPAIVIFPQCPQDDYWANVSVDRSSHPYNIQFKEGPPTTAMNQVMQLLDSMASKPYVNKSQIYLGGMSMGGMGTFELLSRKPDLFAAAFAICGGGNTQTPSLYAQNTPLWVFHGAKDDLVDPQLSVIMVDAYLKAGGKPNFNLYADDNHNSWDSAFNEPKLLPWLFSKSKPKQ